MKHFVCVAMVLLVSVGYVQAAEVPFVELKGHTEAVNSAVFSSDGTKILTGSDDKTVRIWNMESGKELQRLEGHTREVMSVAFSPDGKTVATASQDEFIRIWNIETGKVVQTLKGIGDCEFLSAIFSPDGKKILAMYMYQYIGPHDEGNYDVEFFHRATYMWDVESGKVLNAPAGFFSDLESIAFSSDGKKAITAHAFRDVCIWDMESGRWSSIEMSTNYHSRVLYATFSPDGKKIVTVSRDNTVRIWDASGKELLKLGQTQRVISATFSPDSKKVVTAGVDVRIFDAESGEELKNLEGHTREVMSVAFSPDGKKVVSGSTDNTARIWTLE